MFIFPIARLFFLSWMESPCIINVKTSAVFKVGILQCNTVDLFQISALLFSIYCTARLESLEIARRRFRKFNSKYIESIKIARRRYPPRDTNFPHWLYCNFINTLYKFIWRNISNNKFNPLIV